MFKKNVLVSESLSTSADNILQVFNSAISGLSGVVTKANEAAENKQKEIEEALKEKSALEDIAAKNKAILEKLSNLIG